MNTVSMRATAMCTACCQARTRAGDRAAITNAAASNSTTSMTSSHHTRPSCSESVRRFSSEMSGVRSTSSSTWGMGSPNGPSTRPVQVAPRPIVSASHTRLGMPSRITANVSVAWPRVAATTSAMTTPMTTYASSSATIAYAAGRTDAWKRSSPAGSGAPRDTSRARTITPASQTRPTNTDSGTSVVKPIFGEAPNRSPNSPSSSSPREMSKVWRAASVRPISASSQRTAILAAQPASSAAPATARWRSGRRKPQAITSAPVSVTDSGITVSPACVSAKSPALPESFTVPPTAVTTVAMTTGANAPSGRSAAPAAHRPSVATTIMASSPPSTVPRACTQPWRATARAPEVRAWPEEVRELTLPR